jgi:hypothetical protein
MSNLLEQRKRKTAVGEQPERGIYKEIHVYLTDAKTFSTHTGAQCADPIRPTPKAALRKQTTAFATGLEIKREVEFKTSSWCISKVTYSTSQSKNIDNNFPPSQYIQNVFSSIRARAQPQILSIS